ncbi:class I SAM-dependent methyltransferase [Pseudactinotalea sp. Z1732]|uniref:class I SAM-dependent methyltransferase n=1 Tax=Micrococcales TaxID=85006 RepID=UPI003C79AF36
MTTFDELLAEGAAVPTEGWDFSWFAGRASEERPPWGYAGLVAQRSGTARAMLDVQTGGAEVLAQIPHVPPLLRATESWPPNLDLARPRLTALGGQVVQVEDTEPLPFDDGTFDLVVSRHPTVVLWEEVARVLRPGGTYLSQQVGKASVHELSEAMLGDFEPSDGRSPERAVAAAEGAGLRVRDLQTARLRMAFNDIAAVVHFLRKVIWIVPGFTVEAYRPQLELLHERIQAEGPFVAHSTRFLIEAGR